MDGGECATYSVDDNGCFNYVIEPSGYQIILNPTGWLTSDIVHKAQVPLYEENQSTEGCSTLGAVCNFDVVSGEFEQILPTGSAHWVCVSNIGCQPFDANLYDSLYHDVTCQEMVDQTNDPLDGRLNSLNYAPVQQQNNEWCIRDGAAILPSQHEYDVGDASGLLDIDRVQLFQPYGEDRDH
ncbi:hypothetical protein P5673_010909 [Acropora cervicornis]|uniref:Uncharacterized protein n=1 Tax=Acropora cervicornis TaxID=6130 RepID=A0AAD9QRD7_ACRCE|nr:hypothetical protein P5673_010909 [Acropora cervicornis]